jgi:Tol biopolymer transport system component
MPVARGARLGPYEVGAPIGTGAMGEVYRARDPRLGRDVAVKVLPAEASGNTDRRTRFEHEARAAAALNHPNILAVFDVGHDGGTPYIVSELLEGETLRERLNDGPLPVRKAVEYAGQLAQGLAAAHARGIVHRDLKPENIFVANGDRIKILDFGLAKLTEPEPTTGVGSIVPTIPPGTGPGMILGTVGYMSPEQVRGLPADYRSDIFSFGAILYEMLAGEPPFRRETAADTLAAILHEQPRELSTHERHVPLALVRVVERCLEKVPNMRFHSTDDLAFAVAGALVADVDVALDDAAPPADGVARRARDWAAVAIALVAVAAIAVAITTYLRRPTTVGLPVKLTVPAPPDVVQTDPTIRISPDGSRLVFAATSSDGVRRLWIRPLNALDAAPLGDTEGATSPFWSPDSRSIGYFAGGQLRKIDLAESLSVSVCDAPQAAGGTWSADGIIVFSSAGQLHRVPAVGGAMVSLLNGVNGRREGATLAYPTFLPDGRHILYLDTGGGRVGEAALYGAELNSPDRTLVLPGAVSNAWYSRGYLFFLRNATLVAQPFDAERLTLSGGAIAIVEQVQRPQFGPPSGAFSVSDRVLAYQTGLDARGFPTELTWFDRSGKPAGVVAQQADYGDVEISPDGKRATVSQLDPGTGRDIWIFDLARAIPTRLTADPADEYASVWSPDQTQIIFNSRRKGHLDLYRKASSGAGSDEPVLVDTADKSPMSWSSDGQIVLYNTGNVSIIGNQVDLWALPVSGDRKPFPVVNSAFNEARGRLSPDGRWIAYTSDESGETEIYVTPFPSLAGKWRVSTSGGNWPRWGRDGREIFFLSADGRQLMSAQVDGRTSQFVVGAIERLFEARWRMGARYPYDVAPDGRILGAVLVEQPTATPITLVVDWLADLNR